MLSPNLWGGIALIICASALYMYVKARVERGHLGSEVVERLE